MKWKMHLKFQRELRAAHSRINWLHNTLCTNASGLILHFVSSELMWNPLRSNIYTTRDDVDKSLSPPVNFAVVRGRKFRAREKRSCANGLRGLIKFSFANAVNQIARWFFSLPIRATYNVANNARVLGNSIVSRRRVLLAYFSQQCCRSDKTLDCLTLEEIFLFTRYYCDIWKGYKNL